MSRYRPSSSSSYHEDASRHRSIAPSSSVEDPEATAIASRTDILVSRLQHAQDVLRWCTSTADPFAAMALGAFDKAMRDLEGAVQLIERARGVGRGVDRRSSFPRFPASRDEAGRNLAKDAVGGSEAMNEYEDHHVKERSSSRRSVALPTLNEPRQPARPPHSEGTFDPFVRQDQIRSGHGNRDSSPPPPLQTRLPPHVDRPFPPPASPSPTSPLPSISALNHPPRAPSCPASRAGSPPSAKRDEPTAVTSQTGMPSFSRFFRRGSTAAPPAPKVMEDNIPLSAPALNAPFGRSSSRTSEKSTFKGDIHRPSSAASSSRYQHHRRVTSDSSNEGEPHAPVEQKHNSTSSKYSRSRSRSLAGGSVRTSSVRSEEPQRALSLASAPPAEQEEPPVIKEKEPFRLAGEKIAQAVAQAVSELEGPAARETLLALALVSKQYSKAAVFALFSSVTISSPWQLDKLSSILAANHFLGQLVSSLIILPLDTTSPTSSPDTLIPNLQRLLSYLPNLRHLDEDFTSADWDVPTLLTGKDYILSLSPSSPKKLVSFRSAKCWWEIGALDQLLVFQPKLKHLILGGAAMDRDWEGQRLLAKLSSTTAGSPRAQHLESLVINQCMHEDTLTVLLRSCGGGRTDGVNPSLTSLKIGFQSIGSTDDDTPRTSIPSALSLVGSSLTHLSITAPSKGSEDCTGLLDECLAVLPALEILEFSEQTDLIPVSIASSKTLALLPKTLRVLRGRCVISISTSKLLSLLDRDREDFGEILPHLKEVDISWANGVGEEDGQEPWWKERHVGRIEEAGEELGIKVRVGKRDERLVFP
ncbi:hypothetical protein JCM11251_007029 [Rhodosporidiobolus azoricus]